MVSVLSNSLLVSEILKNVQNETTKRFLVGNTKIKISTNQVQRRIRSFKKLYEVR